MDFVGIVEDLRAEVARIDQAIAALGLIDKLKETAAPARTDASRRTGIGRGRAITPDGRRRLSLAMKRRWREKKRRASN